MSHSKHLLSIKICGLSLYTAYNPKPVQLDEWCTLAASRPPHVIPFMEALLMRLEFVFRVIKARNHERDDFQPASHLRHFVTLRR
jgi:hypothetical protein